MSNGSVGAVGSNPITGTYESSAESIETAPAPKLTSSSADLTCSVESWKQTPGAPATQADTAIGGETVSVHELQAQQALGDSRAPAREDLMQCLAAPLGALAKKLKDPDAADAGVEFARGRIAEVLGSEDVQRALGDMKTGDLEACLINLVKKSWPAAQPDQVEMLSKQLRRAVKNASVDATAFKMQKQLVGVMKNASHSLKELAANPQAMKELAAQVSELDRPGATAAEKQQAAGYRAQFGLQEGPVTAESAARDIAARAALIDVEAKKLGNAAPGTLFRALVPHDPQLFGLKPDSALAAFAPQVVARGKAEQETINHVKLATSVMLAASGAGLGAGAWMALGSAALATPDVALAWKAVDTARAGESAGTMKAGAAERAQTEAVIKTGAAAVEVAMAAGVGAAFHTEVVHHAIERTVAPTLTAAVLEGATHGVLGYGVQKVEHKLVEQETGGH